MKSIVERQLIKITDDLIVKRKQSRKETLLQEIERIKKILKRDFGIEFE